MRYLAGFLLCLAGVVQAAGGVAAPYQGRPVAELIDAFRAVGEPFAYSTNLVGDDLVVTVEPTATEPLEIVRQILRPHGLTIRSEAGVHLVVRFDRADLPKGSVLLVIAGVGGERAVTGAAIAVQPELPAADRLNGGIYEYSNVAPGRYRFSIRADGFVTVHRVVDVWPGDTTVISVRLAAARPEIETISVSASRYEILRDIGASRFAIDQRTVQGMPDLGEDPLRVTQRLPGAAASGASAKTHFRGGEESEIGIMLNGMRLFDPFHVRDYQSIFSAIDSRAIEGIEVYTGGFPVRFGDRMSGLVLMESLEPVDSRHTEIGLSVFNTSLLVAGRNTGGQWLLSARRGNLDLVLRPEVGQPKYYDVFAHFARDLSPDATLSFNALIADDGVEIILESEPEELERVTSQTYNAQLWMQLENRWTEQLSSRLVLSAVSFDNRRMGSLNDIEKLVAEVDDRREVEQYRFRQDWTWTRSRTHLLQWGLAAEYGRAAYDYRNSAEYYSLQALYREQPESVINAATAEPEGGSYALYFADRWKLSPRTVLEWGLRWDDQTYTDLASDAQLSPRVTLLRSLGEHTELRLSWGRYHQSQAINELQIEDGVTNFWPAQRADHFIAGVRHLFAGNYALRVEAFQKNIVKVRPRFENLFDPLGLVPEIQPDRIRLEPDSAQSRGVEISLDRSSGPLTWWATYTWSEVTDRIAGRDEHRSWDQPHALQAGLSWGNEKWDVGIATSVHSGWPTTDLALVEDGVDEDGEPVFVAVPGPRNAQRLGTFASIDMRVSRSWKLRRGLLMAFLEITNLTNRSNECCRDWDLEEDEESGEVSLEYSFDYWLGLMPAVGVVWQF